MDSYVKFAASALSAGPLDHNSFGAFLPLASYQLFTTLGFGWAGSLLGFIGLALSVAPAVLVIKGKEIRARSPFMREAGDDIRTRKKTMTSEENRPALDTKRQELMTQECNGSLGPAGVIKSC
jgi:hypothetical protein